MDLFTSAQNHDKKEKPAKSEPAVNVNLEYIFEQDKFFSDSPKTNPFYDKNVLFSDKLIGSKFLEFQIIGNLGGWADDKELTIETDFYIISNSIINEIQQSSAHPITDKLNDLLNVYSATEKKNIRNYKYKKLKIISEEAFLIFIEKRCTQINDSVTMNLINKLKNHE